MCEILRRLLAYVVLLAAAAYLGPDVAHAEEPDAQSLLARSDNVRNPLEPFALTSTLVEYREGVERESLVLRAYSRIGKLGGQFRSLVRFEAPQKDAGKLMLKDGGNLWFYDPSSNATIRISPQQRLLGQAANGDVATTNFSADYQARMAGTEAIIDGDRQTVPCWKLDLVAKSDDATYHHASLWIAQNTNRPVKARFFAESGKLLKTAYFRRLMNVLGGLRPTEIVLIDGLDPNWITVMRLEHQAWRLVPEEWFQRDYLPRFRPE